MRLYDLFESGKRLANQGVEVSRVTKQDFENAKTALKPLLDKAGLTSGWTAGGAGSFDPEHPYGGGGRTDSGDIDIMIDPQELLQNFPPDVETYNQNSGKPMGPKALANHLADPGKKAKLEMHASKWALADYMTKNGFPTDPGTLTVEYNAHGKIHSVDLIVRPKSAWELHAHDFATDPQMRGGQLFTDIYPTLVKLASSSTFVDPKTGEEKGNLQYSPDKGIVDRDTGQVIAINKNDIAKILLGPNATARDMSSITGIKNALQKNPEKWARAQGLFTQQESKIIAEGIDHPEDLIISQGAVGADRVIKELIGLQADNDSITIKWDGFPAVVFGRDQQGNLVFIDKHQFDKIAKGKAEFSSIKNYDLQRGADRSDLWEKESIIRPALEEIVPNVRDKYWMGDLMYTGTPNTNNGFYVFKPNTVEYQVAIASPLGKQIGNSVGGIAVHTSIPGLGQPDVPLKGLGGLRKGNVVFLTGEIKDNKPVVSVDKEYATYAKNIVKQNRDAVDKFMKELTAMKAKMVITAMSPFITSMLEEGDIRNDIVPRFLEFLKSRLSAAAAVKLLGSNNDGWLYQQDGGAPGLLGIWQMWAAVTDLKIHVKQQIDGQLQGSEVRAFINGAESHEGYVFGSGSDKLKIIDRLGFSAANFAKHRVPDEEVTAKQQMPLAAFCFGRMNPPTIGHGAVMQKTVETGGQNGFIFVSSSTGTDDPLDFATKIAFIKQIYPQYANNIVAEPVTNPIYAANYLYDKGFRNMAFIAGSDRLGKGAGSVEKTLNSWNSGPVRTTDNARGAQGREHVNLQFVSSGDRDPDAGGVQGVSGTKARKYAVEGNEAEFQKATGVGNNIKVGGKTLYQAVREALGVVDQPAAQGVQVTPKTADTPAMEPMKPMKAMKPMKESRLRLQTFFESFNRGGNNPLRDIKDYHEKLDYLHKLLMDPKMSDMRQQINDRIGQLQKAAQMQGLIKEEAAGVGVVKNSKDPRYSMATMGDQNDVDGNTLGKEMKAYFPTKAPKTHQTKVKGSIGKGIHEAYGRRSAYQRDYDSSVTGFGRQRREIDDEANLMYIYNADRERLQQRMVSNHEERSAYQEGFRQTPEQALRLHNIIRSKFDPKKWVQKQGTQWVQVFPYGNPDAVKETQPDDPYTVMNVVDRSNTTDVNGKAASTYTSTSTATDPSTGKKKSLAQWDYTDPKTNKNYTGSTYIDPDGYATVDKNYNESNHQQMRTHGSPYDRGDADAYYGRRPDPHKYVERPDGSGRERVKLTDPEEIKAYMAGYNSGDSGTKDWGESIERKAPTIAEAKDIVDGIIKKMVNKGKSKQEAIAELKKMVDKKFYDESIRRELSRLITG